MKNLKLFDRWGTASKACGLIVGIAFMAAALLIRWISGSPYFLLSQFKNGSPWLPIWLISLLWLGWYFVIGFTFGMLLGDARNRVLARAAWFYRGSLYCVLGVFLGFCWYPLLFRACMPFASLLLLILSMLCFVVSGICWWRLSRVCCLVTWGYCLWLWLIVFSQMMLILSN